MLRLPRMLRCQALYAVGMRSMSTSGSAVVDQMLAYVWKDLKGQGQPAVDVLRSGLSMQPDAAQGFDSGRLQLATSLVYAAEHDWAQAAAAGSSAAAAFTSAAAGDLAGLAGLLSVRALLAAGRDDEAAAAAATAAAQADSSSSSSSSRQVCVLTPVVQQLLVRQATSPPSQQPSAADALCLQERLQSASTASAGGVQGLLLAAGHKVAGDLALGQGSLDAAAASYDAAASAAAAAAAGGGSEAALASAGVGSQLQQEFTADIAAAAAQVSMLQKQWDASEEALSTALKAAEAAAGEGSPLLAPVLLLLGGVYSRSARVMYAEGMLREAAKLLGGTQPARLLDHAAVGSSHQAAHASVRAAVCWRFCQLLTALPNRATEAAAWGAAAQELWTRAGRGFPQGSLQEVLGNDVALKGEGQYGHGKGAIVSLFLRRLVPLPV